MPERDDTGDRLRREFLRQAPVFDLQATLPGKVSALVRRRRVRRRVVMAVAAVVVAAAVAVPLSALRSTPVGHGPTPVTRPTTPSTTPPTSSPNSTPTSTAPAVPLACDDLDLWDTPAGTAVTTTAGLGAVSATLTGTTALTFTGGDPSLTAPVLTVTVEGHRFPVEVAPPAQVTTVIPWSLTPIPSTATATAPTSDALCVAQFPGASLPTVLLGLSTGGAHCCTVVRAIGVAPAGLSAAVDDNMGNPGAALEPDGDDAMIVTADNTFAYQFSSYAASGLPLKLLQFSRGRFVDITSQRPDLLAADAAKWWTAFNADPGNGLGVLAPWVADQCALGQSASAWATVDQLLAEGKLVGPAGWPEGSAYVEALKTFLAKEGRC